MSTEIAEMVEGRISVTLFWADENYGERGGYEGQRFVDDATGETVWAGHIDAWKQRIWPDEGFTIEDHPTFRENVIVSSKVCEREPWPEDPVEDLSDAAWLAEMDALNFQNRAGN